MPRADTKQHLTARETIRILREQAEFYWRMAGASPDPNPYREQAMRLHTNAIKLEANVTEDCR